jgi:pyruvate carboxylase subunit B
LKYFVSVAGQEHEVTLESGRVLSAGAAVGAQVADVEGTHVRVVTIGNRTYRVLARRDGSSGRYTLDIGGFLLQVEALDERTHAIRQLAGPAARAAGPLALLAPMPGLVVRVSVRPGDQVQAGQGVVVIEAMKMENELKAPAAGVVKAVQVAAGSAVEKGAVLVEFEAGTEGQQRSVDTP